MYVGKNLPSGILGGVVVSTLVWNARDVGSIPAHWAICHISITHTMLVDVTMIPYKLQVVCSLNLLFMAIHVTSLSFCE